MQTNFILRNLFELSLIYIFPVLLLYWKIIKQKYLLSTLFIFSILCLILANFEGFSWSSLGFRADNLVQALPIYTSFTIIGAVFLWFLIKILQKKTISESAFNKHLLKFLPLCLFQEFLYRSFLMPKLHELFTSAVIVILVNSILFSFAHIIFPDKKIVLPLTFLSGLFFAGAYYYYPNLFLIFICHSILNLIVVKYSFFDPNFDL